MSIWGDLAAGGVEGLAKGIGGMAKDLRSAITGKSVLTGDEIIRLQTLSQQMEIAALEADKAAMQGQIDVNKIEAASASNFRGGWRPAVGWVCVFGLLYQFLLNPLAPWIIKLFGFVTDPLPDLNMESLLALLFGILGLGTLRTYERVKGVTK